MVGHHHPGETVAEAPTLDEAQGVDQDRHVRRIGEQRFTAKGCRGQ